MQLLASLSIWMNGASLVLAAGGSARIIRHMGLAVVMIAAIVVPLALYYRRHGQQADGRH